MEKNEKKKCWIAYGLLLAVHALAAGYATLLASPDTWGLGVTVFTGSFMFFAGLNLSFVNIVEMLFMKEV